MKNWRKSHTLQNVTAKFIVMKMTATQIFSMGEVILKQNDEVTENERYSHAVTSITDSNKYKVIKGWAVIIHYVPRWCQQNYHDQKNCMIHLHWRSEHKGGIYQNDIEEFKWEDHITGKTTGISYHFDKYNDL